MIKEYYYDKHEIDGYWDKNSEDSIDSRKIITDDVTTVEGSGDIEKEPSISYHNNYRIVVDSDQSVPGHDSYMLETYYTTYDDPVGEYFYVWNNDSLIEYYCYKSYGWVDTAGRQYTTYYLREESIISLDDSYTAYQHKDKADLIAEDVVKDESYPKNGIKDGYWWVRKEEYTIPKPEIISPENGYIVNNNEGEDLPYFVFELQPRRDSDNNKYHARIRLGFRSDFSQYEVMLESKNDQSNWEYYDGSAWQPFPSTGVSANTKVRVKPDIAQFEFGFYYWDCAAYHDFWNYGVNANHRMLVMITETDEVYFLTIGGRRYYATSLNVTESANGELGQINFELPNINV